MAGPRRPLFVVGCPRSGTSPFALWLHACGLSTVSDSRRSSDYPGGYLEHLPLAMFHKALERLHGADHRITPEPFLHGKLLEDPFVARMFEDAFGPVLRDPVDFLKYPQLALSIEFLFERFPGAAVVGLWRNPVENFRSLLRREFALDMIPSSGLKAILLWSLYAHHLVEAKRRRPDRVLLVAVDGFLADASGGPELLRRIGYPTARAVAAPEVVDPARWSRRSGIGWRAYHGAMAGLARLLGARLGPLRAPFADQRRWLRELEGVTDFGR